MNSEYVSAVNAGYFYLIVACVLLFITVMCCVFLVRSYRAGVAIGIEKKVLKKTIISSATFTLLPSISILLGVIALSGTLGVPFSWLRLSVIGALQYELNVAEIAARAVGLTGLKLSEMNMSAFVTVAMVMTVSILGGVFCCIFFLKKYLGKIQKTPAKEASGPSFGDYAVTCMFVGLCGAYIGSYVGTLTSSGDYMPLAVAGVAAAVMAVFEYFTNKKGLAVLDNFSLAASMLVAMIAAVFLNMI
ncbi:MAG: DUF5058 family protein [Clostridiales bacterium]|nr:DUF5058 family protein [Clostridiales bacterium]